MDARIQSIKDPDGRMVSKIKVGEGNQRKSNQEFEAKRNICELLISNKMVQLLQKK
jgi:hypothetical protein